QLKRRRQKPFDRWLWFRVWRGRIFLTTILLLAVYLILRALVHYSHQLGHDSDPVAFVTGNLLNAFLLIAILLQVFIYQRQSTTGRLTMSLNARGWLAVHSIQVKGKEIVINLENAGRVPSRITEYLYGIEKSAFD